MGTGEDEELTGGGGGLVELDADVEHGALDGMATHAAVAVPGEIGQARGGTGHLDDDAIAVEAVRGVAQIRSPEGADATEALVGAESGDEGRGVVQVVDAVADVDALHCGPPRALVVGSGALDAESDITAQRLELVGRHDAAQMDVAGPVDEVAHVGVGVVESEGPVEIERAAGGVEDGRRIGEVVDGLSVDRHPERRFPAGQVAETAAGKREALGVEEGEAGLELPGEGAPVVVGQGDHGVGVVTAGRDDDGLGRRCVGVGPAVLESEGDGSDDLEIGGGEDPGAVEKAGRELLEVEAIEVDGAETIVGHSFKSSRPPPDRPEPARRGARAAVLRA